MKRQQSFLLFAYLGMTILVAGTARAAEELPSLAVPQTATAPVLDGKLDDACWKTAAEFSLGRLLFEDPSVKPPSVATKAWVCADSDYLYFGVRCANKPGSLIRTSGVGDDFGSNDLIEVFIRPQESSLYPYYHFLLAAGNTKRQQMVYGPEDTQRIRDWSVAWPTATRIDNEGWTAEIAIPFHALAERAFPAQPIRFNLTRAASGETREWITWAPVGGRVRSLGFHDPERFGYLSGLEGKPVRPVFAPTIFSARNTGLYRQESGKFFYTVAVTLGNAGGRAGTAEVVLEDTTMDGAVSRSVHRLAVPYMGKREQMITVPVSVPANRTARVILASEEKSPAAAWTPVADTGILVPLTAYPNLNYYSGETEGRFIVGTVYSDAVFAAQKLSLSVRIANAKGKSVLERAYASLSDQGVIVPLPVSRWEPGMYEAAVALYDARRREIGLLRVPIRVEPPPPAGITVSKVDQEQMCLLVNGKPFFPYGFLGGGVSGPGFNIWTQWFVNGLAASLRGLHTVLPPDKWTPWTAEHDRQLDALLERDAKSIRAAYESGLFTVSRAIAHLIWPVGNPSTYGRDHDLFMEKLPRVIETLKKEPGIIMWQGLDEIPPSLTRMSKEHSDLIRKLDPYRVQFTSVHGAVHPEMFDVYDVYAVHDYWAPENGPRRLPYWIQCGRQTAKMFRRPIIATPQAQRLTYKRELTPDERRCGLYLTLIEGAKGLQFFCNDHVMNDVVLRILTYTGREIEQLAPILLKNPPPQTVKATPVEHPSPAVLPELPPARTLYDPSLPVIAKHSDFPFPAVTALVHDKPQGGELLLLANSTNHPASVSIALSSLGPGSRIRGYFDGKEYPVKDGRFTDHFEPYAVRILETFGTTRRPGSPVSVGIAYTTSQQDSASIAYTDIAENGGFEEGDGTKVPGWDIPAGIASRVQGDVRGGAWALRVDKPGTVCKEILLQPDRKYRFSIWARRCIEAARSRPNFFVHFPPDSGVANTGFGNPGTQPDEEWQEFSVRVTTKGTPVKARFFFVMPAGTEGYALLDDFRVEDLSTGRAMFEAEDRRVKMAGYEEKESEHVYSAVTTLEQIAVDALPQPGENILRNSSFEENTLPGLLDNWNDAGGYRVTYFSDNSVAWDGTHSLLLKTNPLSSYHPALNRPVEYQYWSNWQYGKTYTLSAWAKSDKPRAVLRVVAQQAYDEGEPAIFKDFEVGTDWQRCVFTFTVPGDREKNRWSSQATVKLRNMNFQQGMDRAAKIWVDAVQLELGDAATEYKRDPYRAPKIDPKWLSDDVYREPDRRK